MKSQFDSALSATQLRVPACAIPGSSRGMLQPRPALRSHVEQVRESELDIERANRRFADANAADVVRWVDRCFRGATAVASSFGADSAVMLHLVTQVIPDVPVLLIDTGYLFPETYRFAERLRERLGLNLVVRSAGITTARQEALHGRLWEQGKGGRHRYLRMNKVEPMKRALEELGIQAWLSGIRATQTEHRSSLSKVVWQDGRVKVHPILDWTRAQVDAYLHEHDLPRHPLVAQGFRSIGDWHSTAPVAADEDERAGRSLGEGQECGLHVGGNAREGSHGSA